MDHVFRVVLQSEFVIEHAAFEGESTDFDLLEAVLLLLVLLFLLGVLLADPGDHEHVADLELVLLARARVQPHDFLLDAVDEALGVEHAVQLLLGVHQVALSLEAVQFVEAVFLLLLPGYDGGAQPGDFLTCRILQPCVRNAVVIDSSNGFREVSSHDDFTLYCTSNIIQRAFHDAHDVVVSFDLELEEHVERLVEPFLVALVHEHRSLLVEHFGLVQVESVAVLLAFLLLDEAFNDGLFGGGTASTSTSVLGLHVDDGVDHGLHFDDPAVEVRQRVELECTGVVVRWQVVLDHVVDALQFFQLRVGQHLEEAFLELFLGVAADDAFVQEFLVLIALAHECTEVSVLCVV